MKKHDLEPINGKKVKKWPINGKKVKKWPKKDRIEQKSEEMTKIWTESSKNRAFPRGKPRFPRKQLLFHHNVRVNLEVFGEMSIFGINVPNWHPTGVSQKGFSNGSGEVNWGEFEVNWGELRWNWGEIEVRWVEVRWISNFFWMARTGG